MKRSISELEEASTSLPSLPESPQKSKKLKVAASYTKESPYPTFPRPTHQECYDVHSILVKEHGPRHRKAPSTSSNSATTCGSVPNVIESLIGTILSQNTTAANSTRAKENLDSAFGRNNFEAVASASHSSVMEAIKSGGLASKKATTIQKLLQSIKSNHGSYSLQHLAPGAEAEKSLSDEEIMQELISYDGVGPKTASCVLLFCLGRESFAVDTHVFRLSKLLGWVPPKADRVLAQAHLDLRVPGELKYPLHVLMVEHGRRCRGCKDRGTGPCILKQYVREKKVTKVEDVTD